MSDPDDLEDEDDEEEVPTHSLNDEGELVLSKAFLLKRGYCCDQECYNCPY